MENHRECNFFFFLVSIIVRLVTTHDIILYLWQVSVNVLIEKGVKYVSLLELYSISKLLGLKIIRCKSQPL